jgi:acid phosphatase family membrane protein YuiD
MTAAITFVIFCIAMIFTVILVTDKVGIEQERNERKRIRKKSSKKERK